MKIPLSMALALLLIAVACGRAEDHGATPTVVEISQDRLLSGSPVGATVLDVRSSEEFASGHVPGARNIPHDELASRIDELPVERDRPVIVYCEKGGRAAAASETLLAAGFTEVLHLTGDMRDWRANERPMERP